MAERSLCLEQSDPRPGLAVRRLGDGEKSRPASWAHQTPARSCSDRGAWQHKQERCHTCSWHEPCKVRDAWERETPRCSERVSNTATQSAMAARSGSTVSGYAM